MERRFKVYVYPDGEVPITHDGPCKNIYTIEGRFIHEMEHGGNGFRTADPGRAQVLFMPFSVAWMVKYLYKPESYDQTPLRMFVSDYVRVVAGKYPFWNKTSGADHFMLACHDWVCLFSFLWSTSFFFSSMESQLAFVFFNDVTSRLHNLFQFVALVCFFEAWFSFRFS